MDTESTISVIVHKDSSISKTSEESYESYLEDLDETKLTFEEGMEPTRFIMKKTLPYKDSKMVMNSQVGIDEDGKPKVQMSFVLDEVRCALVGMQGAGSDSFVKDKDNYASMQVVNSLHQAGVLMDLYNARKNAAGENSDESKKS